MTVAEYSAADPPRALPRGKRLRVGMIHYSRFEVDSRVQRQAQSLASRGDCVEAVCLSPPETIHLGEGSIRLHHVPLDKRRDGTAGYMRGYASFFAGAMRKVTALHRQRPFDLVEVHNMPDFLTFAALLPKLSGTPVLLDVHDTFPELFATKFETTMTSLRTRLILAEERVSAMLADGMLAVTQEARLRLESRGVGRGKLRVVMNSPDERIFGPQRDPVEAPANGEIRVVYHGGMAPRFGVDTLVRSVASLRDDVPSLKARIYGSCEKESRPIAELAARLAPGGVTVADQPTPFAEIPDRLAECHIGVVPTRNDEFTELLLPVKLMEYVHMGLPVVSSRLPVIERYFNDEHIWFCEPDSADSMRAAIAAVVANPQLARERAARAALRLREFNWPRQREVYLSMVDRLTADRVPAAAQAR